MGFLGGGTKLQTPSFALPGTESAVQTQAPVLPPIASPQASGSEAPITPPLVPQTPPAARPPSLGSAISGTSQSKPAGGKPGAAIGSSFANNQVTSPLGDKVKPTTTKKTLLG